MKDNVLKNKSFEFAIRIVKLCEFLRKNKKEYVLSKQILRSGTSIGALVRESEYAESKADFIHKLTIALKEANETEYWLDLLNRTNYLNVEQSNSLILDNKELLKLLISIIKATKSNQM
jgi:four helix bundle protein